MARARSRRMVKRGQSRLRVQARTGRSSGTKPFSTNSKQNSFVRGQTPDRGKILCRANSLLRDDPAVERRIVASASPLTRSNFVRLGAVGLFVGVEAGSF